MVSAHCIIPTWFVVHILGGEVGFFMASLGAVGKQVFDDTRERQSTREFPIEMFTKCFGLVLFK
jgi:hypothetical protein